MERKFLVSDWISVYRIMISPVILAFIFSGDRLICAYLLLISFLTDAFDGYLARKFGEESLFGAKLDSVGDIATYILALIGIVWFGTDFVMEYIAFFVIAIGLYLAEVLLSFWKYGRLSSFHTAIAKISAVVQAFFIEYFLFFGFNSWFFYPAFIVSYFGYLEEIVLIFILPEWRANVRGVYWVLKERKG